MEAGVAHISCKPRKWIVGLHGWGIHPCTAGHLYQGTLFHERAVVFQVKFYFCHLMKEEIETTHFEHTFAVLGTNRAAETLLTKQVEVVCVSPQPLPWVLSCDEC